MVYTRDNVEIIKQKIDKARAWALNHFNAEQAKKNTALIDENFELLKPSFFVEFPSPDTMEVWPSVMGNKLSSKLTYKLAFVGENNLRWKFQYLSYNDIPVHKTIHRDFSDLDVK